MKYIIVFPEKIYEDTRKFLLRDVHNEQFGYLLAGVNSTECFVKLLIHTFLPAEKREDLEYQSGGGICPSPKFQMKIYSQCKTQGHHLIDVHSHPFDHSDHVRFSGIDDRYELGTGTQQGVFGFTTAWNPGMYHASIVFGQQSIDARVYLPKEKRAIPIDEVQIVTQKSVIPTCSRSQLRHSIEEQERDSKKNDSDGGISGNGNNNLLSRYSRQILAFGEVGQKQLSKTTVGVVGAGGLGSIVVETLARLGIKKIICVDHDVLEESNLSRVIGSRHQDITRNLKKVDVLAQHVKEINPEVQYQGIPDNILNPKTLLELKEVDYIISGTDTHSSRLVLNQFAHQYLIPYIDLGFGMETDPEHKQIISAGGKAIIILPGEWCFECLGEINQRELQIELMSKEDKDRQIARGYISGVNIPNPSVLPLDMIVTSLGVVEFLNLLTTFKRFQRYIFYDMLSTKLWHITAKKKEGCSVCSDEANILGRGDLLLIEDMRDTGQKSNLPSNL